MHKRSDYTFTNPLLNGKFVVVKDEGGQPVCSWRDKY